MDYTIIGSPVNIAARLQELSEPNAILVSKSTQALVTDRFHFKSCGKLELKGIAEAVEAFEVLFADESHSSSVAAAGDQVTVIKDQLAKIDIEQLGDAEREELMSAMSKLLNR